MREKLIGLLDESEDFTYVADRADHLIANGVTIPVRCKDCKYRVYVDIGDDIGAIGGCELFGCGMHYDAFCSYGERRTDD